MSNTNTYSVDLICIDPATELPVSYKFTVRTTPPIEVHPADLRTRAHQLCRRPATLEQLADKLKTQFPGKHTLATSQYGVKLATKREGTGL